MLILRATGSEQVALIDGQLGVWYLKGDRKKSFQSVYVQGYSSQLFVVKKSLQQADNERILYFHRFNMLSNMGKCF